MRVTYRYIRNSGKVKTEATERLRALRHKVLDYQAKIKNITPEIKRLERSIDTNTFIDMAHAANYLQNELYDEAAESGGSRADEYGREEHSQIFGVDGVCYKAKLDVLYGDNSSGVYDNIIDTHFSIAAISKEEVFAEWIADMMYPQHNN